MENEASNIIENKQDPKLKAMIDKQEDNTELKPEIEVTIRCGKLEMNFVSDDLKAAKSMITAINNNLKEQS